MLLEDIDYLCGMIGYKHALGIELPKLERFERKMLNVDVGDVTIVTASCDRIGIYTPFLENLEKDVKISGKVVHVGSSSMDIMVNAKTDDEIVFKAIFTMVAKSKSGSFIVPDILSVTEEEKSLKSQAQESKSIRKKRSVESLQLLPPTPEERLLIHQLIYINPQSQQHREHMYEDMARTSKQSVMLMHPQSKNIHNKIFGGYLMRRAFEQAWSTAYLFAGSLPIPIRVYEQNFLAPVNIGDLVTFYATVTYTTVSLAQVEVKAEVCNAETGVKNITNTSHFTFAFKQPLKKQVMPRLYEEAMRFIESKRREEEASFFDS
eukprot:TRINITY_DN5392_c0_g1_i1.p1 TRINITY_DN5392_c0_g1~~TRINITY_DN5392_c0_g1_i1.p1  ORF type:complete len:320 (-),score=36.54 TRINITY_DN5392_c0_g1_i1:82-1041(-)